MASSTSPILTRRDVPLRRTTAQQMTEQLDQTAVAARLGVTRATIQKYRTREYLERYGFPEPDGMIGRTPWWRPETIDAWAANRPGQGVGGGRRSSS